MNIDLVVNDWTTECGSCGYGRGGWAASPALQGKPILRPDSRVCHGCGERFTRVINNYTGRIEPIADLEDAA